MLVLELIERYIM